MSITIANLANMEKAYALHGNRVIAYSPFTHEEYSANPGDYFGALHDEKWVMRDETGAAMHLVVRQVTILDALSGIFTDPED